MSKPTERKGFNFLRSYKDTYELMQTDKDKADFMKLIIDKQFYGIDPDFKTVSPFVQLAYTGQKHSLDKSVKGFEDKTGLSLQAPLEAPLEGNSIPLQATFEQVQEKVEGKEKVQEKVKEQDVKSSLKKEPKKLSKVLLSDFPFTTERFLNGWKEWLEYRVEIKKSYKSARSEKMALNKLARENETESNCLLSIEQSIAGGYIGLFKIKENGTNKKTGYDPSNFTPEGIDRIINGTS